MSCRILLISGSVRSGSTNAAMLATAEAVAPPEIEVVTFEGLTGLPHFNPDDDFDPLPAPVVGLRAEIERSGAVLICTPEYAGALPGSLKNLLEWTVGGAEMYGRPVAWINVSGLGRGEATHRQLRRVLGYVNADIVEEACAHVPVDRSQIGADGRVSDGEIRERLAEVLTALATHVTSDPREEIRPAIAIRPATLADLREIVRLAQLDSAAPLPLPALIAERAGTPVAAIAVATGAVVADPFKPTADVVAMLELRRRHLAGDHLARSWLPRVGFRRRRPRAAW